MFPKSVWIPILIVLLAVIGCGLFYSQKTTKQEPITIIKPVGVERPPAEKPPPPGDPAESGRWHGDVWHAEPHEAPFKPVPVEVQVANNPGNASDQTEGLSETHIRLLKALPDATVPQRVLKKYALRHYQKYPDCQEHEAMLADAKRYTEWVMADRKHVEKHRIHAAELTDIMDAHEKLLKKYNYRPVYEATHIPESERLNDIERGKALMVEIEANRERSDALAREKPIYPKLQHTH